MPANGRWDLIRHLKVNLLLPAILTINLLDLKLTRLSHSLHPYCNKVLLSPLILRILIHR